jgi:hypothetical protein
MDPQDDTTKLVQIARNAGAVYVGHVEAGEGCLSSLVGKYQNKRLGSGVIRETQKLFKRVYSNYANASRVMVLLAFCSSQGRAELWQFDSKDDFVPVQQTGVRVLAHLDSTAKALRQGLDSVMNYHLTNPSSPLYLAPGSRLSDKRFLPFELGSDDPGKDVGVGATWLETALDASVIGTGVDITVGGPMQSAVMYSVGFLWRGHAVKRDNDESWKLLTPAPGELRAHSKNPQIKKIIRRG